MQLSTFAACVDLLAALALPAIVGTSARFDASPSERANPDGALRAMRAASAAREPLPLRAAAELDGVEILGIRIGNGGAGKSIAVRRAGAGATCLPIVIAAMSEDQAAKKESEPPAHPDG